MKRSLAYSISNRNVDEPLQFLVTLLDYNEYLGRIAVGRVNRGKIRQGQSVAVINA